MAKYEITKIEEKYDKCNYPYLKVDLLNTYCVWEGTITVVIHDQAIVQRIMQATDCLTKELPDDMKYVYGQWTIHEFDRPFYKKHTSAHPAVNGRPAINVGDLVCVDGVPVEYRSLSVFCLQDGNGTYLRGWSPAEIAYKAFRKYCVYANERANYAISAGNRHCIIEDITRDNAMKCAEAIHDLTNNEVVLSKVIYKLKTSAKDAMSTGCSVIQV